MRFSIPLVTALLVSTLCGCSQTPPNAEHGTANVVASTGAWASVAAAVVGQHATVRSLMPADADPRAFTPGTAAVSEVADASLVVYNGGRYDQWIAPILKDAPDIPRIDALSLTPLQPPADDHVFYDVLTAKAVADRIAETLGESDAEHAADYTAAAQQFDEDLDTLTLAQHAIGQAHPGASVISIAPVARCSAAATCASWGGVSRRPARLLLWPTGSPSSSSSSARPAARWASTSPATWR